MVTGSQNDRGHRFVAGRLGSCRAVGLALLITLLQTKGARAEDSVNYKYQHYLEDADRILVKAHYLAGQKTFGHHFELKAMGLVDSISGATPTGQPAPEGSDQVPLTQMEDERKAVTVDGVGLFGPQTFTLQYAYSTESDYKSNAVSVSATREFNDKNTTVQMGYAYTDDSIYARYLDGWQDKTTHDFIVGVTQLIDPRTSLTVNLTYGDASGFLNDPYKLVEKNIEILPGLSLPLTFPENRPTHRTRFIALFSLTKTFEKLGGTMDASYRYFEDNRSLVGHTVSLDWYQKIGDRFILRPNFRWHRQSAVDFYHVTLDGTEIDPTPVPTGLAPFYSADYRLSEMDTFTYGLKGIFEATDWLRIDATVERYEMKGRDDVTSASAYPKATVVTVGLSFLF